MTSRYIYTDQEKLVGWAAAKMGESYPDFQFRSDAKAIGHERRGDLVGVVVFDTLSDNDCMVHLVSDGSRRWLTRAFIIRAMAYPFLQLKFRRITALVSERNEDSLRFTQHFGWKEEGVLRNAGPAGEDMIIFGMLREECRWLSGFRSSKISDKPDWKARAQDVLSRCRRPSHGKVDTIRAGTGSTDR